MIPTMTDLPEFDAYLSLAETLPAWGGDAGFPGMEGSRPPYPPGQGRPPDSAPYTARGRPSR